MAGNETHDNAVAPAAASADAATARWWDMPFDKTTSFSLLGFFMEAALEERASGSKIDLELR